MSAIHDKCVQYAPKGDGPVDYVAGANIGGFVNVPEVMEYARSLPNVVFAEGLVALNDSWFLYYGMGDSGIGVAKHR